MHNIALGITAWCLLSVPTGLAVGRTFRRHGRRSRPAAPAYASARSSSTSQRYSTMGVIGTSRTTAPDAAMRAKMLDRGALRAVVVEQDRVVRRTGGHQISGAQAALVRIPDPGRTRRPAFRVHGVGIERAHHGHRHDFAGCPRDAWRVVARRERARESRHHHPRVVRIDPRDSRRLGRGQLLHAEHGNA